MIDMTVAGLLKAYRTQQLSPEDVIASVLARCAEHDDLNMPN